MSIPQWSNPNDPASPNFTPMKVNKRSPNTTGDFILTYGIVGFFALCTLVAFLKQ